MASDAPDPKKTSKWNPFHRDKDKHKSSDKPVDFSDLPPVNVSQPGAPPEPADEVPSLRNEGLRPRDSTYGGSEQSNSTVSIADAQRQPNLAPPTMTNLSAQNSTSSSATNAPNHEVKINGDFSHSSPVVKRETHTTGGATVTTTTTTTTTTTVVSGPYGTTTIQEPRAELPAGRMTPEPTPAVQSAIRESTNGNRQGAEITSQTSDADEPAYGQRRRSLTPGQRPIPQRDPINSFTQEQLVSPVDAEMPVPRVPSRSPHRTSFSAVDSRPVSAQTAEAQAKQSHNFSYPSRQHQSQLSQGGTLPHSLKPSPGTLANLKTAAIGLHGVADTLRGTINIEADRLIRPDKVSEAKAAKNQQAVDRGRYEIESGRLGRSSQRERPPASIPGAMHPDPMQDTHSSSASNTSTSISGVDQPPNTTAGYTQPETWGSGWKDHEDYVGPQQQQQEQQRESTGSKIGKWMRKAGSSVPGEKSTSELEGPEDASQKRTTKKLRRRSGPPNDLRVVSE